MDHESQRKMHSNGRGMYKRILTLMILSWLVFSVKDIRAQIKGIQKGDVVRISVPSVSYLRLEGEVLNVSSEEIRIANPGFNPPWRDIALHSISEIEVYRVVRGTGRGAAVGAITGGLTIGLLAMAGSNSCGPDEDFCIEFPRGPLFLGGAVIGGLSGALIGALVGSTVEREEWKRVEFEVESMAVTTQNFQQYTIPGISFRWSL